MGQAGSALQASTPPAVAVNADEIAEQLQAMAPAWAGPGARVLGLERLSGGASQELWAFEVQGEDGRRPYILRRNPGGAAKRESAAGMAVEARLIRLSEGAGAPPCRRWSTCQRPTRAWAPATSWPA
jgi:aminoglycoside phosphotransferase (APT) family kinase protein